MRAVSRADYPDDGNPHHEGGGLGDGYIGGKCGNFRRNPRCLEVYGSARALRAATTTRKGISVFSLELASMSRATPENRSEGPRAPCSDQ